MSDFNPELIFSLLQKAFLVFGSVIYTVFALIVTKQVVTLSKGVTDKFNGLLIISSYLHLALSVLLIILVLLGL